MLSSRARSRVLLGAVIVSMGGVSVASCGGNNSKKIYSGEAGEAGESGSAGAAPSSGGGSAARGGAMNGAGQSNGGAAPADDGGFGGAVGGFGGTVTEPGAGAAGVGGEVAGCSAAEVPSRIKITFDTIDPERVLSLQWIDSAGATSPNVTGQGGPLHCDDPQEFFGQSYGAPEGTLPDPVVGGYLGTAVSCAADITITAAAKDCTQAAQMPVTTQYHFYRGAQASQMRITRTFGFDATTTVFAGTTGLRPYVPRVSINHLINVIYPNLAGTAVASTPATACGGDCFVPTGTTWNGKWFADIDPNSGLALIVLRDPSMTTPVDLTVNYDSFSNANLASFVVLQPAEGWKAPLTEVEYLCFADLVSWPQTARDAAQLPAGCGP
jgi:hypothetical protein